MQFAPPRSLPSRRHRLVRAGGPPALLAIVLALAWLAAAAGAATTATSVVSWGENSSGKLANGGTSFPPASVVGIDGLAATGAAASTNRSFVITPDAVYGAGEAANGGLGLGEAAGGGARSTPLPIPGTAGATAVTAGGDATLVLKGDGTVVAFGRNQHLAGGIDNRVGGTGNGLTLWDPTPIPGLGGVRAISAGLRSSLALKQDGTVWTWGHRETLGSLDAFNAGNSAVPVQVRLPDDRRATAIVAGYQHHLALLEDGSIAGWGLNDFGELGDGTRTARRDPVLVSGIPTGGSAVVSIAAGWGTGFALLADGSFLAWGANDGGQLGLGNGAADVTIPTAPNPARAVGFPIYPRFTAIVAGSLATYGIASDGRVHAWGYNDAGQLGGPVTSRFPYPSGTENPPRHAEIPQRVGKLKDVPWLAAGSTGNHQLALTTLTLQTTGNSETSFFSQQLGTIGPPRTTSLGAVGDPATISRVRVAGPNARDFLIVGTTVATLGLDPPFPVALAAGRSPLAIDVRFAPSGLGERHATLVVESDSEVARVPLDGFGVALTGGPAGPAGPAGGDGAPGKDGTPGRDGRNGKNGVVRFVVASATTVKRGRTASLRVTVRNGTSARLPRASIALRLPRALRAAHAQTHPFRALRAGGQRRVALPLRVPRAAKPGTYRVTVRLTVGRQRLTRAVPVRVVR